MEDADSRQQAVLNLVREARAATVGLRDSNTITGRRTFMQQLLPIVCENDDVARELDSKTDRWLLAQQQAALAGALPRRLPNLFTWTSVLDTVIFYVNVEVQPLLADPRKKTSRRLLDLRNTCAEPLARLLARIEGRGPRLFETIFEDSSTDSGFIAMFLDFFQDEFLTQAFAGALLPVLRGIFATPCYIQMLQQSTFERLIEVFGKRMCASVRRLASAPQSESTSSSASFSSSSSSSSLTVELQDSRSELNSFTHALATLLENFPADMNEQAETIFDLLMKVFGDLPAVSSPFGELFRVINIVLVRAAVNCISKSRSLFAEVMPKIRVLWPHADAECRSHILRFIRIQLRLHHDPVGDFVPLDHLNMLYGVLLRDFDPDGGLFGKPRHITGSSHNATVREFIPDIYQRLELEVYADVFFEADAAFIAPLEVSVVAKHEPIGEAVTDFEVPFGNKRLFSVAHAHAPSPIDSSGENKRQRVRSFWEMMVDTLSACLEDHPSDSEQRVAVHWLRIVSVGSLRHRVVFFSSNSWQQRYSDLVSLIWDILTRSRPNSCIECWSLHALEALALSRSLVQVPAAVLVATSDHLFCLDANDPTESSLRRPWLGRWQALRRKFEKFDQSSRINYSRNAAFHLLATLIQTDPDVLRESTPLFSDPLEISEHRSDVPWFDQFWVISFANEPCAAELRLIAACSSTYQLEFLGNAQHRSDLLRRYIEFFSPGLIKHAQGEKTISELSAPIPENLATATLLALLNGGDLLECVGVASCDVVSECSTDDVVLAPRSAVSSTALLDVASSNLSGSLRIRRTTDLTKSVLLPEQCSMWITSRCSTIAASTAARYGVSFNSEAFTFDCALVDQGVRGAVDPALWLRSRYRANLNLMDPEFARFSSHEREIRDLSSALVIPSTRACAPSGRSIEIIAQRRTVTTPFSAAESHTLQGLAWKLLGQRCDYLRQRADSIVAQRKKTLGVHVRILAPMLEHICHNVELTADLLVSMHVPGCQVTPRLLQSIESTGLLESLEKGITCIAEHIRQVWSDSSHFPKILRTLSSALGKLGMLHLRFSMQSLVQELAVFAEGQKGASFIGSLHGDTPFELPLSRVVAGGSAVAANVIDLADEFFSCAPATAPTQVAEEVPNFMLRISNFRSESDPTTRGIGSYVFERSLIAVTAWFVSSFAVAEDYNDVRGFEKWSRTIIAMIRVERSPDKLYSLCRAAVCLCSALRSHCLTSELAFNALAFLDVVIKRTKDLVDANESSGEVRVRREITHVFAAVADELCFWERIADSGGVVDTQVVEQLTLFLATTVFKYEHRNSSSWQVRFDLVGSLAHVVKLGLPVEKGAKLWDKLANALLRRASDRDLRVRLYAALCHKPLFEFVKEDQLLTNIVGSGRDLGLLPSHSVLFPPDLDMTRTEVNNIAVFWSLRADSLEAQISSIFELGQVAIFATEVQQRCILYLCQLATGNHTTLSLTRLLVGNASSVLRFPSTTAFLAHHVPALITLWLNSGRPILEFPFQLLSERQSTISDVIREFADSIVPRAVLACSSSELEAVAAAVRLSVDELLRTHFAEVAAAVLPFEFCKTKSLSRDPLNLVRKTLSTEDFDARLQQSLPYVISAMFKLIAVSDSHTSNDHETPQPPNYSAKNIQDALLKLVKRAPNLTVSRLLFEGFQGSRHRDMALRVLLDLRTFMRASAERDSDRRSAFRRYVMFALLLEDRVTRPAVFREVMRTLLISVSDPTLQHVALDNLNRLCKRVLGIYRAGAEGADPSQSTASQRSQSEADNQRPSVALAQLSRHTSALLTTLSEYARKHFQQYGGKPTHKKTSNIAFEVLRTLIEGASELLEDDSKAAVGYCSAVVDSIEPEVFADYDSIRDLWRPLHPTLERLKTKFSSILIGEEPLAGIIERFLRSNTVSSAHPGGLDSAVLEVKLKKLLRCLSSRQDELVSLATELQSADAPLARLLDFLTMLSTKFSANVRYAEPNQSVLALLGSCIGAVGWIPASSRPVCVFLQTELSGPSDVLNTLLRTAVEFLVNLVVDDDVHVCAVASNALRGLSAVLDNDARRNFVSALDSEIFHIVNPYWRAGVEVAKAVDQMPTLSIDLRARALREQCIPIAGRASVISPLLSMPESPDPELAWIGRSSFDEWLRCHVFHLCGVLLQIAVDLDVNRSSRALNRNEARHHLFVQSLALVFETLAPMCWMREDFAAAVLPYLMYFVLTADLIGAQATQGSVRRSEYAANLRRLVFGMDSDDNGASHTTSAFDIGIDRILNALVFARFYTRAHQLRPLALSQLVEEDFWSRLDYLNIVKASLRIKRADAALLFLEYWCDREGHLIYPSPRARLSLLDSSLDDSDEGSSASVSSASADLVDSLLLQAQQQKDDSDSLHGASVVVSSARRQKEAEMLWFESSGEWMRLRNIYDRRADAALRTGDKGSIIPALTKLSNVLVRTGELHNAKYHLVGLLSANPLLAQATQFMELQAEQAWRTAHWSLELPELDQSSRDQAEVPLFHRTLFLCLRGIVTENPTLVRHSLMDGRESLIRYLGRSDQRDRAYARAFVSVRLQALAEVERCVPLYGSAANVEKVESLLRRWQAFEGDICDSFADVEPLLATRSILMDLLSGSQHARQLLDVAQLAQRADYHSLSLSILEGMVGDETNSAAMAGKSADQAKRDMYLWSCAGRLLSSRALAAQADVETALAGTRHVIRDLEEHLEFARGLRSTVGSKLSREVAITQSLLGEALLSWGSWVALEQSDASDSVRSVLDAARVHFEAVEQGADILVGEAVPFVAAAFREPSESVSRAWFEFAKFNDARFVQAVSFTQSRDWEMQQAMVSDRKRHLISIKDQIDLLPANSSDLQKRELQQQIRRHTRTLELDAEEFRRLGREKLQYLADAVASYISCLRKSATPPVQAVFRLFSLWFEFNERPDVHLQAFRRDSQSDDEQFGDINEFMRQAFTRAPLSPVKLLPLAYQIASRLTEESSLFGKTVRLIVLQLMRELPHHTVWQIIALSNASQPTLSTRFRGRSAAPVFSRDKVNAAKALLEEFKRTDHELYGQMAVLAAGIIDVSGKRIGDQANLPDSLLKLKDLGRLPVLTVSLLPHNETETGARKHPHKSVSIVPYIHHFDPRVTLVGGINAPKRIECHDSEGNMHKQLIKGEDDLRQDQVMEQIFGLVNVLLRSNRATRVRGLSVRTYKVIPLAPKAGVLEWVDNTQTLGTYLTGFDGQSGAHRLYRPQDLASRACRAKMDNPQLRPADRVDEFKSVCSDFKPVMHHFFLERHSDPVSWHRARTIYTRSVAASSIVGYIVGLGDRHAQNILIDKVNSEVIHIDLGVAFEQGKVLPTPELIPFRLTRDIVDGMGVLRYEGTFRRSCEEMVKVLRNSGDSLLTVVEVFIHDPLYNWSLSSEQAQRRQQESRSTLATDDVFDEGVSFALASATTRNTDAERAILRIRQKLLGMESGELLSVPGQVTRLLSEATDVTKLAKLFPGWAPWL